MSFDLSQLRFTVDTKQLDDAITKVGQLTTSVASLNKPLSKLGTTSKTTATDIDTTTKSVETNSKAVKTNQSILERQEAILNKMSEGWSKGQSSILASAKAAGIASTEMVKLESTLASQRKLLGNDPFDKSASGLISLTQGLGSAREGYRQMIKYQEEFQRLQKEGNGEELRLVALNKKETDSLYRDKQRMIEQYKLLKNASFDSSDTAMIDRQKNAYKDLVQNVKNLESTYKQVATAKRPLDDLRTIDSTKQRDKLNYLARATSVQLGDIGVSLAGGQNPLTVLLQQGDQMRAIFGDIGREGHDMQTVLNSAFTQIVTGFRDVAKNLGKVVLIAITDTAKAFVDFTLRITGVTPALDALRKGLVATVGESSGLLKGFDAIGKAASVLMVGGLLGIVVVLATLAIAYKNILATSHELSNALILNGAALATTKTEAMKMSEALASGSATSMDVAKVITEIASASNLGKESIEGITKSAIEMNRYLGVATGDVVKEYSKLATDPVKTLTEIGMATGRITAGTIDSIRELEEQGKHIEAVAVATKELDRIYGEMSQNAKDNMTPLGKLWDDMKQSMNLLTDSVYKFAQSESVVNALTAVWKAFAATLSSVVFLMKQAVVISAQVKSLPDVAFNGDAANKLAVDTKAALSANFADFEKINKSIFDPQSARNQADATKAAAEAHAKYITVVKEGVTTTRLETKAEVEARKANREGIEAAEKFEKLKNEFGANSRLDPARRAKAIADKKSQADVLYAANKKDLERNASQTIEGQKKLQEDLAKLQKDKEGVYFGIEEKFKDKKPAGQAGAIRDTLSAEQQRIENDRNESVRASKMAMDAINSEHKRGLVNDYDYVTQKAQIEQKALNDSIGFYTKEIEIAKKKVNSKKEVETLEGKIKKAKDDIKDKELEKQYAQLEFTQKLRDAVGEEIKALDEKSKAQKLENELIGKTAEQITAIKAARLDNVIALQKEHVEYMVKNGYSVSSAQAYDMEKAKLDALIKSREVNIETLNAEIAATIAKNNAANSDAFNKDMGGLDKQQKDLDFREKLLGKTQEQKDAMKRAYDLENQLEEVKLKKQEAINQAAAEYNRLLSMIPEVDYATKAEDIAKIKASYDLQIDRVTELGNKQEELIKKGANLAEKELADAKLEKFSAGIADALVTGMTDGAKAGKKKLRDLIVAELTKTITLNIQANIKSLLSGGGSGGGLLDMLMGKGSDSLLSTGLDFLGGLFGMGGGSSIVPAAGAMGTTTTLAGIEALSAGAAGLGASAAAAAPATVAATGGLAGLGNAAMAALGPVGLFAAGAMALFAIFGFGNDEMPSVLNDLALFNNSLIGLPFLDLAVGSDEAAQGLRDVLYGLDNATPTMKKLAGETISLSVELLRASGDIAGAANLARNLGTRGMSEAEIAVYDYNQGLKDQIEAARAGQQAAQAAAQAEEQLAKTRWDLAGKLNILLGRTTQKEFDRATQLAATSDAASLEMLNLIFVMEDLTAAVDTQYAVLERSIAAERKLVEARLASATALQGVLKTAKDATTTLMTRGNAQLSLTRLLAIARSTGVLPSADAMKPLLDALTAPSEDLFSTFEDYQRDFLKTAYNIREMSSLADDQVSLEQKTLDKLDAQLEQAKAQLDALKGVDNSVKDVATAIKDFDAAMQALGAAKTTAGTYNYSAPVAGGAGGGGSYGGGGGGTSGAAPTFEDIAGQENKDIVAAYREYYNRNPDTSGYDYFVKSLLTGDKLMQAILGASSLDPESQDYKTAVSKGYNPLDPKAKFLKSKTTSTNDVIEGAFAKGINYVPNDMIAQIHEGERILPAADNAELFARLQNPQDNAVVMAAAISRLTDEVKMLRAEQRQTVINTGKTADSLKYTTNENGTAFNVVIET